MSQYGPQGDPVTVPATPPEPAPQSTPVAVAAPEIGVSVQQGGVSGYVPGPPAPEPTAEEIEAQARRAQVDAEQRIAEQAAAVQRTKALLADWEDRAAKTLIKSDYQRGQRDNLLACIGEVRKVVGL